MLYLKKGLLKMEFTTNELVAIFNILEIEKRKLLLPEFVE